MSSAIYSNRLNTIGLPTVVLGGTNQSVALATGNTQLANSVLSVTSFTGPSMILTSGSPVVTIPSKGLYAFRLQLNIANTSGGTVGVYIIGSNNIYYALNYTQSNGVGAWCQCTGVEVLPAGITLTPCVYTSGSGSVVAQDNTLSRFTVSQIWTSP